MGDIIIYHVAPPPPFCAKCNDGTEKKAIYGLLAVQVKKCQGMCGALHMQALFLAAPKKTQDRKKSKKIRAKFF